MRATKITLHRSSKEKHKFKYQISNILVNLPAVRISFVPKSKYELHGIVYADKMLPFQSPNNLLV